MWRSKALGGTIREPPESLTEAGGPAGVVRLGPFVPAPLEKARTP